MEARGILRLDCKTPSAADLLAPCPVKQTRPNLARQARTRGTQLFESPCKRQCQKRRTIGEISLPKVQRPWPNLVRPMCEVGLLAAVGAECPPLDSQKHICCALASLQHQLGYSRCLETKSEKLAETPRARPLQETDTERRLRESQVVDERITPIYSIEDFRRESKEVPLEAKLYMPYLPQKILSL